MTPGGFLCRDQPGVHPHQGNQAPGRHAVSAKGRSAFFLEKDSIRQKAGGKKSVREERFGASRGVDPGGMGGIYPSTFRSGDGP